ncbi:hypothetical protein [Nocardioides sp. KR10-350]|uniref:hypothetical protein n=1 Tax=Nocardioides cheoyonin TaxID=3156615 RepID=UPI0032B5413A
MSSAAHRDAVATLSEKATPYFVENQLKWRSKPVSQARLALAIDQLVAHMRDKKVDMATMTGLTAYRDDDGIHVTIELGTLPLE